MLIYYLWEEKPRLYKYFTLLRKAISNEYFLLFFSHISLLAYTHWPAALEPKHNHYYSYGQILMSLDRKSVEARHALYKAAEMPVCVSFLLLMMILLLLLASNFCSWRCIFTEVCIRLRSLLTYTRMSSKLSSSMPRSSTRWTRTPRASARSGCFVSTGAMHSMSPERSYTSRPDDSVRYSQALECCFGILL